MACFSTIGQVSKEVKIPGKWGSCKQCDRSLLLNKNSKRLTKIRILPTVRIQNSPHGTTGELYNAVKYDLLTLQIRPPVVTGCPKRSVPAIFTSMEGCLTRIFAFIFRFYWSSGDRYHSQAGQALEPSSEILPSQLAGPDCPP